MEAEGDGTVGRLIVSSLDGKEIVLSNDCNFDIQNGYSVYGIRPMPMYYDTALSANEKN